jgi:hypothetical protein
MSMENLKTNARVLDERRLLKSLAEHLRRRSFEALGRQHGEPIAATASDQAPKGEASAKRE